MGSRGHRRGSSRSGPSGLEGSALLQDFLFRGRRGCRSGYRPFDWKVANDADQPKERDMQYLLLIYQNEAEAAARGQAGRAEMHQEYMTFTQSIIQGGQ